MVLLKTFTEYLTLFSLALIVIKLFSQLVFSVLKIQVHSRFYRLSCQMLLGVVMLILAYSAIITHAHTAFLGLIIPLGLATWFFGVWQPPSAANGGFFTKETIKDILVLLALGFPLYAWEFSQLFDIETMSFKTTYIDYYFYSILSNCLNHYKVENYFGVLNQIAPTLFTGTSPYHFAELWINACLTRCTGAPAMLTLMFVCYPLLYTIVVLAILSTWEALGSVGPGKILLTYLLLLANGFSTGIMEHIAVPSSYCYVHLSMLGEFAKKLAPVYVIVACTGMFYYRGKTLLALFCFSLLAFFYLTLFPAVLLALFVAAVFLLYTKSIDSKSFYTLTALAAATGIFLFAWFAVNRCEFKNDALKPFHPHITELLKNPRNIIIYKDIILLVVLFFLKMLLSTVLFLPFIGLYIYFIARGKIAPDYLLWLLAFVFLGVCDVIASLMNPVPDTIQLFANALPAFIMLVMYAVISILSYMDKPAPGNGNYRYAGYGLSVYLILMLALPFYKQFRHQNSEMYSAEYVEQCKSRLLQNKPSGLVTFLRTKSDFAGNPFEWMWRNTPGILAMYYGNPTDYTVLNLPDADFYRSPDELQLFRLKQQPVYIYDKYGKHDKHENNKDSLVYNFVQDYQVKFIFSRAEKLPQVLYPLLLDSVSDKKSGEVCYRLK